MCGSAHGPSTRECGGRGRAASRPRLLQRRRARPGSQSRAQSLDKPFAKMWARGTRAPSLKEMPPPTDHPPGGWIGAGVKRRAAWILVGVVALAVVGAACDAV